MIYMGTASSPLVREAMSSGLIGQMITPISGNRPVEGVIWGYDNGCFSGGLDEKKWLSKMRRYEGIPNCKFAALPDVLCNSEETDKLWAKWVDIVKGFGYKAAYVTQNGAKKIPSDADALFTGGDNDWKLGKEAQCLVEQAKSRGLWCHMGRVNSQRRVIYAYDCGYDSVDGTHLSFGPDKKLPELLKWMNTVHSQGKLL